MLLSATRLRSVGVLLLHKFEQQIVQNHTQQYTYSPVEAGFNKGKKKSVKLNLVECYESTE